MAEPLTDSLKKIARGTGVALLGTFLALLIGFVTRLIIARYGSEADYGIYSLAIVILTFALTLACLGLPEGVARYIAYFRGREEAAKIRGVISVSLQLAAAASVIISIALFFSAKAIASNIFHTPDLALALKAFAIGIPFFTLINILVSVFRGFDRMEPQAYFQYGLFSILFLLLVSVIAILHLSFADIFYTYVIALILTFAALLTYTIKRLPQPITFTGGQAGAPVRKGLLFFSLPLLGTAILATIILWADTLLLGYFKTPEVVGLYNAASPLAKFISEPLAVMLLIYTPVATGLHSRNLMAELRRNYIISTKWIVSLTLPLFLVLCLFPEAVLNLFFGPTYVAAAPALRILSLGFIINNLFGPNQSILLAIGESRFIMWTALSAAIVSVLLNVALIPPLGIVGAAIATAVALVLTKAIIAVKVFSLRRAQPLSQNLLKPVVASIALALLFKFATHGLVSITWWMLVLLFTLYYAIYAIAVVLTRSFDREDIALLLEIEKISGINASPVKRILGKFVQS
jgi:O-antigen/teichoic acid export membrane protein